MHGISDIFRLWCYLHSNQPRVIITQDRVKLKSLHLNGDMLFNNRIELQETSLSMGLKLGGFMKAMDSYAYLFPDSICAKYDKKFKELVKKKCYGTQ